MEELENEYDKGIYWIIFFVIIIIVAILGYKFVFNYEKNDDSAEEATEEKININDYRGVWALKGEEDLPNEELIIDMIDGSTITFSYFVKDTAYFESQTAEIIDDEATFNATDRDEKITIIGKLIFNEDKISVVISNSNVEDISLGMIEFNEKVENSLLK